MAPKSTLTAQRQKAYDAIVAKYILSDDGKLVLRGALEAYDDYTKARELVRKIGVLGPDGKKNPACDFQVACYKNFVAGFRYLGLSATPEDLGDDAAV